jgi:hypothetical protein
VWIWLALNPIRNVGSLHLLGVRAFAVEDSSRGDHG